MAKFKIALKDASGKELKIPDIQKKELNKEILKALVQKVPDFEDLGIDTASWWEATHSW